MQGSIVLADGVLQFCGKMCQTGRQSGQDTVHRNGVIYLSSLPYLSYRFTVLVTNCEDRESGRDQPTFQCPVDDPCLGSMYLAYLSSCHIMDSATAICNNRVLFCHSPKQLLPSQCNNTVSLSQSTKQLLPSAKICCCLVTHQNSFCHLQQYAVISSFTKTAPAICNS